MTSPDKAASPVLAEALHVASTEKDEWHAEHQGSLVDIRGHAWWCGDEWCDCSQAQIVARFRNTRAPGFIVTRQLWQGQFHTDGEPGADDELTAKQRDLLATEPELAARIIWPSEQENTDSPGHAG